MNQVTSGDQIADGVKKHIERTAAAAGRGRYLIWGLFPLSLPALLALGLLLYYSCEGWDPMHSQALPNWFLNAILAGGAGLAIVSGVAVGEIVRQLRARAARARLKDLSTTACAELLFPFRNHPSWDTRRLAASLIRELARGSTEVVPGPAPAGHGDEASPAGSPEALDARGWGGSRRFAGAQGSSTAASRFGTSLASYTASYQSASGATIWSFRIDTGTRSAPVPCFISPDLRSL